TSASSYHHLWQTPSPPSPSATRLNSSTHFAPPRHLHNSPNFIKQNTSCHFFSW
ncbi:hypothetical protein COCVIDRAFT_102022, partial [Bipolaris victoriae FI3]